MRNCASLAIPVHILHVLSQYEVTGAEVYAATLANAQAAAGHTVWIVSDTFSTPTHATVLSRDIGVKALHRRAANALWLRGFVRDKGVHVVHAHSRAASKVSLYGLMGTGVGLVSTVHGRQHLHGKGKKYDVFGQRIIAVCANIATHLVEELGIDAKKISVIPNGFEASLHPSPQGQLTPPSPSPQGEGEGGRGGEGEVLLLAGRATGPKGQILAHFLDKVAPTILAARPNLRIQIAGAAADTLQAPGPVALAHLQQAYPGRVEALGFVPNLPNLIRQATAGVVGSGRIALEALLAGRPVFAIGECLCHGLVTEANLEQAIASNFGDVAATQPQGIPDVEALLPGLLADAAPLSEATRQSVAAGYALPAVADAVFEQYCHARALAAHPGYIPVLMYHKVPDAPLQSQHKTFVPKAVFAKQMAQLARRGFATISFAQYHSWRAGAQGATLPRKPIVLSFDDGYADNLTNALPILQRHGFTATLFAMGDAALDHNAWDVATGETREPLLTPDELLTLAAAGWEIGAHTLTHRDLTTLPEDKALHEMAASRAYLKGLTGQPVLAFAYPYGRYNPAVQALARQAGFAYAVCVAEGGMHWEDDRYAIFRPYIFPQDVGWAFYKKAAAWYRSYYKRKRGI